MEKSWSVIGSLSLHPSTRPCNLSSLVRLFAINVPRTHHSAARTRQATQLAQGNIAQAADQLQNFTRHYRSTCEWDDYPIVGSDRGDLTLHVPPPWAVFKNLSCRCRLAKYLRKRGQCLCDADRLNHVHATNRFSSRVEDVKVDQEFLLLSIATPVKHELWTVVLVSPTRRHITRHVAEMGRCARKS